MEVNHFERLISLQGRDLLDSPAFDGGDYMLSFENLRDDLMMTLGVIIKCHHLPTKRILRDAE